MSLSFLFFICYKTAGPELNGVDLFFKAPVLVAKLLPLLQIISHLFIFEQIFPLILEYCKLSLVHLNILLKIDFIMFILILCNSSMECHFCFRDPAEAQQVSKFHVCRCERHRYSLLLIDCQRKVVIYKILSLIL